MLLTVPLCCTAGLKIVVGDEEQARRCQAKLQNLTFTDQALLSHGNRLLFFLKKKGSLSLHLSLSFSLPASLSLSLSLSLTIFVGASLMQAHPQQRCCNRDATEMQRCCNSLLGAGSSLLQHIKSGRSSWRPLRRAVDEARGRRSWLVPMRRDSDTPVFRICSSSSL